MVFGILAMVAFNLVDTFFVAQLGTQELAAMSFTFPIVMVVGGFSMGLGVGASVVVSRALGGGQPDKTRRLATDALVLSVLVVAVVMGIGLLTVRPVLRMLGASDDIVDLAAEYLRIWFPGTVFLVVPMVGNSIIRATGDMRTPSAIMVVAVLVNAILDPLLIFGLGPFPRMELAGAAVATVIARAITFFVAVWVLARRDRMFNFSRRPLREVLSSWARLLYVGLPNAGANIIMPLAVGVVTHLIAGYGPEAVAAYGVAARIDMFALTVVMALGSVLSPFIGQNWGAGRLDRVCRAVFLSQRFVLLWGAGVFILMFALGDVLSEVFTKDARVALASATYLAIVPVAYGMQGSNMLAISALNALNHPLDATALRLIQMFTLYIPFALLGSHLLGLTGIFIGVALTHIVAGSFSHFWLQRILKLEGRGVNPCDSRISPPLRTGIQANEDFH